MAEQTVQVRKGGIYLDVPESAVQRYMARGYDVVDRYGNVIKACVPNELGVLQKAFVDKSAEIERLMADNLALRKQIEDLLAAISDIKPEQPKEVVEEVLPTPKRKKSK